MLKTHKSVTLYKIDENGKYRYYNLSVIEKDQSIVEPDVSGQAKAGNQTQMFSNGTKTLLVSKWGELDGAEQEKSTEIHSKNVGKRNQTTPVQQALNELEALILVKENEGYFRLPKQDIFIDHEAKEYKVGKENFDCEVNALKYAISKYHKANLEQKQSIPPKPMLLHHLRLSTYVKGTTEYDKSKEITYPCYVQPKKDGVCCVGTATHGLWTRENKDRLTPKGQSWNDICPQIYQALQKLNYEYPLHGEVYLKGYTLQQITSACKKGNNLSPFLEFHIFDVIVENETMQERQIRLNEISDELIRLGLTQFIKIVPYIEVDNEQELIEVEESYLTQGEEGVVARNKNGLYKLGSDNIRSNDVLKLVRFDSNEFEIVNILPMENEPEFGIFLCENQNRDTFLVTPSDGFTAQDKRNLLKNKKDYIGSQLTVRHRGYTDDGLPRIAIGVAKR